MTRAISGILLAASLILFQIEVFAGNTKIEPKKDIAWSIIYNENMADTWLDIMENKSPTMEFKANSNLISPTAADEFQNVVPNFYDNFYKLRKGKGSMKKNINKFKDYKNYNQKASSNPSHGDKLKSFIARLTEQEFSEEDYQKLSNQPVRETEQIIKSLDLERFAELNPEFFEFSESSNFVKKAHVFRLFSKRRLQAIDWKTRHNRPTPEYLNPLASINVRNSIAKNKFENHVMHKHMGNLDDKKTNAYKISSSVFEGEFWLNKSLGEKTNNYFPDSYSQNPKSSNTLQLGWIDSQEEQTQNKENLATLAKTDSIIAGLDFWFLDILWFHGAINKETIQTENYDEFATSEKIFNTLGLFSFYFTDSDTPLFANFNFSYSNAEFMMDEEIFLHPITARTTNISALFGTKHNINNYKILLKTGLSQTFPSIKNNPRKLDLKNLEPLEPAQLRAMQNYSNSYFEIALAAQADFKIDKTKLEPAIDIKYQRRLRAGLSGKPSKVYNEFYVWDLEDMKDREDINRLFISPSIKLEFLEQFSLEAGYKYILGDYSSSHGFNTCINVKL